MRLPDGHFVRIGMEQYIDDDHREGAHHFTILKDSSKSDFLSWKLFGGSLSKLYQRATGRLKVHQIKSLITVINYSSAIRNVLRSNDPVYHRSRFNRFIGLVYLVSNFSILDSQEPII